MDGVTRCPHGGRGLVPILNAVLNKERPAAQVNAADLVGGYPERDAWITQREYVRSCVGGSTNTIVQRVFETLDVSSLL